MKLRRLFSVGVMLAGLLMLSALAVSAASGSPDIGKAVLLTSAPAQGTLAPGESAWFKFIVPQAYTVEQMKRDQRRGATITDQVITMQFDDASNPDVAHNTGFRLYDPQRASWVLNGTVAPIVRDVFGEPVVDINGDKVLEQAWWAIGSPDVDISTARARAALEGVDIFVGRPKVWKGILHDAGAYYIQVYNESDFPMNFSLSIAGPNLALATTS